MLYWARRPDWRRLELNPGLERGKQAWTDAPQRGPETRGLDREGARRVVVKVAGSRITITTTRRPWSKHFLCGISFHPPHSLGSHGGGHSGSEK